MGRIGRDSCQLRSPFTLDARISAIWSSRLIQWQPQQVVEHQTSGTTRPRLPGWIPGFGDNFGLLQSLAEYTQRQRAPERIEQQVVGAEPFASKDDQLGAKDVDQMRNAHAQRGRAWSTPRLWLLRWPDQSR